MSTSIILPNQEIIILYDIINLQSEIQHSLYHLHALVGIRLINEKEKLFKLYDQVGDYYDALSNNKLAYDNYLSAFEYISEYIDRKEYRSFFNKFHQYKKNLMN